jgi:hypothetical protein
MKCSTRRRSNADTGSTCSNVQLSVFERCRHQAAEFSVVLDDVAPSPSRELSVRSAPNRRTSAASRSGGTAWPLLVLNHA